MSVCSNKYHLDKQITHICFDNQCPQQKLLCIECLKNHQGHIKNILSLHDLNNIQKFKQQKQLSNEQLIINQFFKEQMDFTIYRLQSLQEIYKNRLFSIQNNIDEQFISILMSQDLNLEQLQNANHNNSCQIEQMIQGISAQLNTNQINQKQKEQVKSQICQMIDNDKTIQIDGRALQIFQNKLRSCLDKLEAINISQYNDALIINDDDNKAIRGGIPFEEISPLDLDDKTECEDVKLFINQQEQKVLFVQEYFPVTIKSTNNQQLSQSFEEYDDISLSNKDEYDITALDELSAQNNDSDCDVQILNNDNILQQNQTQAKEEKDQTHLKVQTGLKDQKEQESEWQPKQQQSPISPKKKIIQNEKIIMVSKVREIKVNHKDQVSGIHNFILSQKQQEFMAKNFYMQNLSNKILVTSSIDRTISVFDYENGYHLYTLENAHSSIILTSNILPISEQEKNVLQKRIGDIDKETLPQSLLITSGQDGKIRLWNVINGTLIQSLFSVQKNQFSIFQLLVVPITKFWESNGCHASHVILAACSDGQIRVWDWINNKVVTVYQTNMCLYAIVHASETQETKNKPKWILGSGSSKSIYKFNVDSNKEESVIATECHNITQPYIICAEQQSSSELFSKIEIRSVKTGNLYKQFAEAHLFSITSLLVINDSWIFSGSNCFSEKTLKTWVLDSNGSKFELDVGARISWRSIKLISYEQINVNQNKFTVALSVITNQSKDSIINIIEFTENLTTTKSINLNQI